MKGGCMIRMFCQWCRKRQKHQGGKPQRHDNTTVYHMTRSKVKIKVMVMEVRKLRWWSISKYLLHRYACDQKTGPIFDIHPLSFLPARRYASAGYRDRNVSVRPSVCPSVCPSVTRRYCVKTKKASVMISSPSGSPKTLVF